LITPHMVDDIDTADLCILFFFQAEDGIRDRNVTGVQTCALPISVSPHPHLVLANATRPAAFPPGGNHGKLTSPPVNDAARHLDPHGFEHHQSLWLTPEQTPQSPSCGRILGVVATFPSFQLNLTAPPSAPQE